MKARKRINCIWLFLNILMILCLAVISWAIISNERNMNLGLWYFLHGKIAVLFMSGDMIRNIALVIFLITVLLMTGIVFSKVVAKVKVGNISIDLWVLWNFFVTSIILLSAIIHIDRFYIAYMGECEIYGSRCLLEDERTIVHGAGWIEDDSGQKYDYTNSFEALANSYQMGNRVIEIDFIWTLDEKLVCAHNDEPFARGIESEGPLTEAEFLEKKSNGLFTTMNLAMLANFMRENQDMYVVTDFKGDCVTSCQYIDTVCPDLKDRFIIQIYHYDQYESIRNLGFNNLILTLYQAYPEERDTEMLCEFAKNNDLVAITFWEDFINYADEWTNPEEFFDMAIGLDTPICVHTVNNPESIKSDLEQGVAAVYTDSVDNAWVRDF